MTTTTCIPPTSAPAHPRPGPGQRFVRSGILSKLGALTGGVLTLRDTLGEQRFGVPASDGLEATITVADASLYTDVALRGVLGAGEAYAAGAWVADDLVAVVRLLLRNRPLLTKLDGGLARLSRPLLRGALALNRNNRRGSRRNIEAHYDLGNAFFALFLDDTMTYSAGIFDEAGTTLREASLAKYDRLCRKARIGPNDHVLEIGCGWGGFAEYAASQYGCRVTATTISRRQAAYARDRIEAAGLADRVRIVEQDYRDLTGTYDRIVSIEMIEAVGHSFLDTFAETCSARLRPGGVMALQAITIDDRHYDRARRTMDFIKRYIFPGSFIPSVKAINDAFVRSSTLRLRDMRDIGPDYAETLRRWRERFLARRDDVRAMGFPSSFVRLWEYYFAYCEAGFREGFLGDVQLVLTQPARHDA